MTPPDVYAGWLHCARVLPLVVLVSCTRGQTPQLTNGLFGNAAPIEVITPVRVDPSGTRDGIRDVSQFVLGPSGSVAILDPFAMRIDEYDSKGSLLRTLAGSASDLPLTGFVSLGRATESSLAIVQRDRVVLVDMANGAHEQLTAPDGALVSPGSALLARNGAAFVSRYSHDGTWDLIRVEPSRRSFSVTYTDNSRKSPVEITSLNYWPVRPVQDANGEILVADQLDYRISVFDEAGQLVRTVRRNWTKQYFDESDLHLRLAHHTFPLSHLVSLPKELRALPAIVGIRTMGSGTKLVFTSFRDPNMRFRIDIFDTHWNFMRSVFEFNSLRLMPFDTWGNRVAVADLRPTGNGIPNSADFSRLEAPSIPTRILVYRVAL